jgi:hypothetical protein
VRRDAGQPQRPWFLDQQAEQAAPLWPVVDLPDFILRQANGDELGQFLVVTDDAQRPVGRVHQPDGRLHDPPQR